MTTPTLPPVTLWEQFYVVAIIVLVVAFLGIGAFVVFKEYQKWQSTEQEKQRKWQEEQSTQQQQWLLDQTASRRDWQIEQNQNRDKEQLKRDQLWQEQLKENATMHIEQERDTTAVLTEVIKRMDALTIILTLHDERAKDYIKDALKR